MAEKPKNNGRRNSGRKPIPAKDRKQQICIYIPAGQIEKNGGAEILKEKIRQFVAEQCLT